MQILALYKNLYCTKMFYTLVTCMLQNIVRDSSFNWCMIISLQSLPARIICTWNYLSLFLIYWLQSVSSVAQSCPTLCDPMNRSTSGLPVHHQVPKLAQTHVHWVSDAIQPFYPLLSPSPPAFNLSQHQGLLRPEVKAGTGEHFHGVRGSELRFRVLQLTGERVRGARGSEFCYSSKNCTSTVTSSKAETESKTGSTRVYTLTD